MFPRLPRVPAALCPLWAGALLLSAAPAGAFTFNRNAAHIDWRTVETEHFRFHYPRELEEVAGHVAGIAEAVAPRIIARYNVRLPGKVEFVVRDDIFSNGWANSLQNTMTVWATDWDFPVRSTHNWLRDVVTHEFAHLVSIQSGSKLPAFLQGVVVGYDDYYNEPVQGRLSTVFPFINQPAWFAEGVAQYESERAGFDAWDSHRDMLLRVAALENGLLPVERMGVFAGNGLEYELGPYTQGFGLTRFIAARYGDEALIRLWAENSRIHRQTLSGSMKRVLGKTEREVYQEWKSEITDAYTEQVRALGTQVYGKKLTSRGFYNYYPRWDSKGAGIFFVSNGARDDFRAVLGHVKLEDTAKAEAERFTAIPGVRGYFDVATDDSTFLFASAKDPDPDGVRTLDVYQRNLRRKAKFLERKDPTEKRFTRDFNAAHASYSRDGKRVAFVRGGASNFRLYVAPVPEGDSLDAEDAIAVFPPEDLPGTRFGFNIYTPRFSPDGKRILFSYFDGETRNIGLVNADGTGFRALLARPHDERDPEWAPDGKSFYYSSDETGIYNIRRHTLESTPEPGADEALTNVTGGAFSPVISPDGAKLAYVNYDKDGFSLYLLDVSDTTRVSPPVPTTATHAATRPESPAVETLDFSGRAEAYVPVPTRGILTPILYGQEAVAATREKNVIPEKGVTKWLAGASGYITDPVLKNELSGALLAEIGNGFDYFGSHSALVSPDKESQLFLSFSNHSTPVTLGASFFRGNINSYDTVTYPEMPLPGGGIGDLPVRQNYAITFRGVEASASYNLFDATAVGTLESPSFVRLAAGYAWNAMNFYSQEDGWQGFAFTYYRDLYLNTLLSLYGADYNDKGLVAPSGLAAVVAHTVRQSDLFGCESDYASDCFVIEGGVIVPKYRTYVFHDLDAGLTYGAPMPWSKNSALVLSGFYAGLLDWRKTRDEVGDTVGLDDFFEKGLFLRGYPYLRDLENLALSGENTLTLSADLNQPLFPDIYRRYWVVFVEDLYLSLFWEAGRAWNGAPWDAALFSPSAWKPGDRADGWHQSVGTGLKVNAKIYHNYPFLMYVEAARALSGISDGAGGSRALETVRVAGVDTRATQIRFGVSFGLYNGLLGRKNARHPLNPRSPFVSSP